MKLANIAVLLFATVTIACGVDVTDPQAGYFDDHTDKSGTQNFNNMGSGTMEVNINYNNQTTQPTVVNTVVPAASSSVNGTVGYLIAGMQIEYINGSLYGTNLNQVEVNCDIAYRSDAPHNGYFFNVQPNLSDDTSIIGKTTCITITSVNCKNYDYSSSSYGKTVANWVGSQQLCQQ